MATQPDNWEAVKALFEAALEEEAANRSSFLKARCPDASVCAEAERLLAEHDEAASFLSAAPLGNIPATPSRLSEGEVLAGRFRIVRFIAGGGMGDVYEADDQELRDRVAVKTIRPEISQMNSFFGLRTGRFSIQITSTIAYSFPCWPRLAFARFACTTSVIPSGHCCSKTEPRLST
jgi:hypothetical protein